MDYINIDGENMTPNCKKVLSTAAKLAVDLHDQQIGTEYLLYGLVSVEGSVATRLLKEVGVTKGEVEKVIRQKKPFSSSAVANKYDFTPRVKNIIETAFKIAYDMGENYVVSEDVLFALLSDDSSSAVNILKDYFNVNISSLLKRTADAIRGTNYDDDFFNMGSVFDRFNDILSDPQTTVILQKTKPAPNNYESEQIKRTQERQANINANLPEVLQDMGIDMTARARSGKMDPIIGREKETARIIEILCRKTKNNPVLIGDAGVGKSAVIEGLAQAIVKGDVPEFLQNKIIFSLDIGSLMAGTKYRGSMEEKLKNAINTIISAKNIIVFIDEIHMLAQAGSKEGEVSPSDMLKPYLARGEMQTIGATTTEEYRQFIEKDKALERRFQPIIVEQPSVSDAIKILKGIRNSYEAFHKVKITDDAIEAAVNLSVRYIMDRSLPDKAIDLIDEASSRAKVNGAKAPENLKELEAKLKDFEIMKLEASKSEDYDKANEYKLEADKIREKIENAKKEWKSETTSFGVVTSEDIARVVSSWTKIPVTKLTETEKDKLVHLEEILHKRVIGQEEAVSAVSKAIRRARAGLKDPKRPIGSFIFLGPTGVGKTELAKALAEAMFDDENMVIRIDMSEFMESHSVAKLIGAPPGYVGHEDGGQLTEQVRRKPYSVILFDEIEKAHPDVFNIMLQILDDGRLTDSQGRTVNFKNTIVIMTSNCGVSDLPKASKRLGFDDGEDNKVDVKEHLMKSLQEKFKPEFLNRVDVICIFDRLSKADISKIASILINNLNNKLQDKKITLRLTKGAMDEIIDKGYSAEYGARPLKRFIEQKIEDSLAESILSGQFGEGSVVTVGFRDGKFTFTAKED
ncbi:MAG: ATP-dependent Clp protease ATP-binding subunit [bacterium]|nr:ATP-dependent Clp protease ATP-binding subunit [bacterium]